MHVLIKYPLPYLFAEKALRRAMLMTKIKRLSIKAARVHVRYEVRHVQIHHHVQ